jgi:chromosome segregation ATPase
MLIFRQEELAKVDYETALSNERSSIESFLTTNNEMTRLETQYVGISKKLMDAEAEVVRLENALMAARAHARTCQTELLLVQSDIRTQQTMKQVKTLSY